MIRTLDFVHGYQPAFVFKEWFLDNLKEVFLPTSESMKRGLIKRHVQLQGWTLDLGLGSDNPEVRETTKKIVQNLKSARFWKNIELGFSAYSHAILPLCSDYVAYMQMKLDYEVVSGVLGKPSWFFFPEGCADSRTFTILKTAFPRAVPVMPDRCFPNTGSKNDIIGVQIEKTSHPVVVFDVWTKDILMGAASFPEKPKNAPKEISWPSARRSMYSGDSLVYTLNQITKNKNKFIVRDWENGESKNALSEISIESGKKKVSRTGMKEIKSFIESEKQASARFSLLKNLNLKPEKTVMIDSLKPGAWEPVSTIENPYPYWSPSDKEKKKLGKEKRKLLEGWLKIMETFNFLIDNIIIDHCLRKNIIKRKNIIRLEIKDKIRLCDIAMKDPKIKEIFRSTSPALISCFPWHFTTPGKWDNDVGLSLDILQKDIKPNLRKLVAHFEYYCSVFERKEEFFRMLDSMEDSLQKVIKDIIEKKS